MYPNYRLYSRRKSGNVIKSKLNRILTARNNTNVKYLYAQTEVQCKLNKDPRH